MAAPGSDKCSTFKKVDAIHCGGGVQRGYEGKQSVRIVDFLIHFQKAGFRQSFNKKKTTSKTECSINKI